jgi:hypothetical protein
MAFVVRGSWFVVRDPVGAACVKSGWAFVVGGSWFAIRLAPRA